jgi:phi13 family phage major tail protein
MATVGFDTVKIAVLDENEQTTAADTYTLDKSLGGAIEAAITGLAPTQNVLYASNVPFYVSSKGTGDTKIALTVGDLEDLPDGALDKILGRKKDGTSKITVVGADTEAPYCAVELLSKDKNGKVLFISLLKVRFTFEGDNMKSSDNNGATLSQDQLTGSAVARSSDGLVYAKAREADSVLQTDFETFVFPQAPIV